jgi:hypothetical protein
LSYPVTTLAYAVPLFENVSLTSETFKLSALYQETDPNQLGAIRAIELWKQEDLVASFSTVWTASFASLTHATEYKVVAVYAYDLQDGQGEQILRLEQSIQTLPKQMPTLWLQTYFIDYDSIVAGLRTTDIHKVMTITAIAVYRGEVPYGTYDVFDPEFELLNLYSNETIRFVVNYTVDLDDGLGAQAMMFETTLTTLKKVIPIVVPSRVSSTSNSMTIRYYMDDSTDSLLRAEVSCQDSSPCILPYAPNSDILYMMSPGFQTLSVTVKIYYDLNDGFGVRTSQKSYTFTNPNM